jgi:LysM repeat protein
MIRTALSLLAIALLLGACASAPPPEPVSTGPRLIGEPIEPRPEPAPDPEPTLEERWRAPFAVLSSGSLGARPTPVQVAVDGREPVAPAAPTAAAEPAAAAPAGAAPAPQQAATQAAAAARPTAPTPAAAPTPAPAAATAAAAGTRTHRVEWGETWFGIARRYNIPSATLAAANPGVDPERIRTGQVLRIPGADPALRGGQRSHTVGPGDSLWGIARRYGVTMERIRAANRLSDDQVRLGQTLIIPPAEAAR